jgi:death-on-curing family protein
MKKLTTYKNIKDILVFKTKQGKLSIDVKLSKDTVWLSLNQLSDLFERDKSVISRHLNKVFKEKELQRSSTVAFFATVQIEGGHSVTRKIEYFNLDVILSVGYRVNSKRGVQFRRWASNILQDYLLEGYAINHDKITSKRIHELEQTLDLLAKTLINQSLVTDLGNEVINIIHSYSKTWSTLLEYDENRLSTNNKNHGKLANLEYSDALKNIKSFKSELASKGEASSLFGLERDNGLARILGNISQTFSGKQLYKTNIERAANLLYFIIKDHPFTDGNKRIGCLLFLVFLSRSDLKLSKVDSNGLIALALLVAESAPKQKIIMVELIKKILS